MNKVVPETWKPGTDWKISREMGGAGEINQIIYMPSLWL